MSLQEHLRAHKCEIAVVIEECISALRENWMDTEGLFRLAASAAKIKFLKVYTVCKEVRAGRGRHIQGSLEM